jgi:segregation and condensation protein B
MENTNLSLEAKIESFLFYKGEPVSFKEISKSFEVSEEEVLNSIKILEENLKNRGIRLVLNDKEVMLGTAPELSSFFENLRKEELNKELSRASLETLSIVLYKEKVSRADIDYIRGVNSGFILRNLSVRGLVDKIPHPKDSRISLYSPSLELLSHLGVSKVSELPDYESVVKNLQEKVDQISNENN